MSRHLGLMLSNVVLLS